MLAQRILQVCSQFGLQICMQMLNNALIADKASFWLLWTQQLWQPFKDDKFSQYGGQITLHSHASLCHPTWSGKMCQGQRQIAFILSASCTLTIRICSKRPCSLALTDYHATQWRQQVNNLQIHIAHTNSNHCLWLAMNLCMLWLKLLRFRSATCLP